MERRHFIKRLSLAAAGGLCLRNSDASAAGGRKLARVGAQLYTVRREL